MNENRRQFVVVVPFISNNEIVMMKQYVSRTNSFNLELPSDRLQQSESPNEASKRILMQIGFEAKEIHIIREYEVYDAAVQKGSIFSAYGNISIDSKDLVKLSLREVEKMLLRNEVAAASSIIALYHILNQ